MRGGVLEREEGTAQIDRQGALPFLDRELLDRRPYTIDAGIGEDDVQAFCGAHQALDRALHGACVGDIGDEDVSPAALLLDLGSDGPEL
jgi:hypothetical protein